MELSRRIWSYPKVVRGTIYGSHKRSPPAITGPGRTIRGNKIIVKKGFGTIFGCRLIRRTRNVLAIYELPSSNEDQMEFRYKHWCGRAERGRTRVPPCRRYSGGTSYGAGGPVMARRNWSPGPNLAADQLLRDRTGSIRINGTVRTRFDWLDQDPWYSADRP